MIGFFFFFKKILLSKKQQPQQVKKNTNRSQRTPTHSTFGDTTSNQYNFTLILSKRRHCVILCVDKNKNSRGCTVEGAVRRSENERKNENKPKTRNDVSWWSQTKNDAMLNLSLHNNNNTKIRALQKIKGFAFCLSLFVWRVSER